MLAGNVMLANIFAKFQDNRFRGFGFPDGRKSPFFIDLAYRSYNTNALQCDKAYISHIFCLLFTTRALIAWWQWYWFHWCLLVGVCVCVCQRDSSSTAWDIVREIFLWEQDISKAGMTSKTAAFRWTAARTWCLSFYSIYVVGITLFDGKDVVLHMQMIALRHRQDMITRVEQLEQSAVELARHGQPSLHTNINLLTMICILTEA